MDGRQWMPADGTIIKAEPARGRHGFRYTIAVRTADGSLIRRTIRHKDAFPYQAGTMVRVEIAGGDEIRIDPLYPGAAAVLGPADQPGQPGQASDAAGEFGSPGPAAPPDPAAETSGTTVAGADAEAVLAQFFGALVAPPGSKPKVTGTVTRTSSVPGPDGRTVQAAADFLRRFGSSDSAD
jgi:hypothetical protein